MLNWQKKGKIFDPTNHNLSFDVTTFAQSPQILVLNDRVRIYFSTRIIDEPGKFISKIEYVDFDLQMDSIIGHSTKQVIPMGTLGTFDEHGIFPISPFQHDNQIWAYTCGWSRRISVSVETSTGLAISSDGGETFEKVGHGPILTTSLHEPFLVGDSFVRYYSGSFHMWYIFGIKWITTDNGDSERIYKIGYASSQNGIDWKKNEGVPIIPDVLGPDECQALPTVIFHQNRYHVVFCYRYATDFRKNPSRGYRLGYAWSDDLHTWNRDDNLLNLTTGEHGQWDSEMMCYPHLFEVNGVVYLLYNGNLFGKEGFGLAKLVDIQG
jgi:hypothetical protein